MSRVLTMGLLSPMMSLLASPNVDLSVIGSAPILTGSAVPRYAGFHLKNRSKYDPHQGKKECARRVRQMQAQRAKAEG